MKGMRVKTEPSLSEAPKKGSLAAPVAAIFCPVLFQDPFHGLAKSAECPALLCALFADKGLVQLLYLSGQVMLLKHQLGS